MLRRGLGRGGDASRRRGPQGKALARTFMGFPIAVPADWREAGGPLEGGSETFDATLPAPRAI